MKVVAGLIFLAVTALSPHLRADDTLPQQGEAAAVSVTVDSAALDPATQDVDAGALSSSEAGQAAPAETPATPVQSLNTTSSAFAHDLSPWGMYQAADWVVKAVMIGLALASVLTWAVLGYKTVQLRQHRRNTEQVLAVVARADNFVAAKKEVAGLNLKQAGSAALAMVSATDLELSLSARGAASAEGIKERVSARLDRVLAAGGSHMNKGTGVLATIGSTAPFVGLFGTVWGIMNAFIGIAESQATNLAVVAPGIAEALLATALGLVAAIPAVVIYNHFSRGIGVYRADLADVSTALLTLVSRDLDRVQARQA